MGITRLYIRLSHKIRPPFWQIVSHFKPECSTVHHETLYFFNYWVAPPCNTVDTRYLCTVTIHNYAVQRRICTLITFVYTLEVHYCTPYIFRHYCIALPYNSIHSWGIVHSTHITCSLFTPLTAALPQYCLA